MTDPAVENSVNELRRKSVGRRDYRRVQIQAFIRGVAAVCALAARPLRVPVHEGMEEA